ncbi:MAG: lipopolysaccharide biosynthesis protein, partial [Actinobacteria bacterium]|nr:lipopolysaccharide biosynthesis protein [Actinomycetota bacterium]
MSAPAPELRRLARGGSGNLAGLLFYGAASFFSVVIVTRGLGAREAGAFLIAVAAFSILVRTTQLGADIGMV